MRLILLVLAAVSATASPAAAVELFDFSDLQVGVDTVGTDYEVSAGGLSSCIWWPVRAVVVCSSQVISPAIPD